MKRYFLFLSFQLIIFTLSFSMATAQENSNCNNFPKARHGTYVIAHRGAHIGIPENSLAAYQKAIDLGCDFVEIDARTTKDGKFVSVHNSSVDDYVKGTKGKVRDMTLAELRALDIGERVGPEWKGTKIPTFEEILQLCKGKIGIYLDLKDADVTELMKIIRKYDMESSIVWYTGATNLMHLKNVDELFGASFIMPDPGEEKNLETVIEKLRPCLLATDMGDLSASFMAKAGSKNVKVFVDEKKGTEKEWQQILDWKTDGIQTNYPEKLINYLERKNNKLLN